MKRFSIDPSRLAQIERDRETAADATRQAHERAHNALQHRQACQGAISNAQALQHRGQKVTPEMLKALEAAERELQAANQALKAAHEISNRAGQLLDRCNTYAGDQR